MKAETARCPAVDKEPDHEIDCQYPGGHPRPSVCRVHGPPTGAGAADPSLPPAGLSGGLHPGDGVLRPVCPLGSAIPQEQMVQVFDQSGKLCVMRPDSTTPIARVAATKLRALPLPQRLYYDQTVYRPGRPQRREPGAPPVRGGADRSRRDESGSGDGGHSSGRPAGVRGLTVPMWSWATPASSGMWPPGWSWRRGRWSGCGP